MSETCRVVYQNEVEKQCILLAFIIRTVIHISGEQKMWRIS